MPASPKTCTRKGSSATRGGVAERAWRTARPRGRPSPSYRWVLLSLDDLVGGSLCRRGQESLVAAVGSVQEDAFDADEFTETLDEHLGEDPLPARVRARRRASGVDDVGGIRGARDRQTGHRPGSGQLLHRRRYSGHDAPAYHTGAPRSDDRNDTPPGIGDHYHKGSERFEASIAQTPAEHQEDLRRLLRWARELENHGLATLSSTEGKRGERFVLSPLLKSEGVALATN